MLMFAFIQFASHVQKAYRFTDLKGYFTCLYSAMVQETSVYSPIQIYMLSGSGGQLSLFSACTGNRTQATCMDGSCLNYQTVLSISES